MRPIGREGSGGIACTAPASLLFMIAVFEIAFLPRAKFAFERHFDHFDRLRP